MNAHQSTSFLDSREQHLFLPRPKSSTYRNTAIMPSSSLAAAALFLLTANAATLARRAVGTATVSLASPSGTPSRLASGFIYGIPDNGTSISTAIPDNFYRDFGFRACRAGGAQLVAPNRG